MGESSDTKPTETQQPTCPACGMDMKPNPDGLGAFYCPNCGEKSGNS